MLEFSLLLRCDSGKFIVLKIYFSLVFTLSSDNIIESFIKNKIYGLKHVNACDNIILDF